MEAGRSTNGRIFDQIVIVDWSANARPKLGKDSIWIAVADAAGCTVENLPTRAAAEQMLAELLDETQQRSLVGVDFSLGYPSGTAAGLGLLGWPWESMWQLLASLVVDDERNGNNRFVVAAELNERLPGPAGPFWGCPPTKSCAALTRTKPLADEAWPAEWRRVEQALRDRDQWPASCWQLLGAGSVGSQSLTGIPMLESLRRRFEERIEIWPFTTGLRAPDTGPGSIVVVEVWPSLWPMEIPPGDVRDAVQVESVAGRLRSLDQSGGLRTLFAPCVAPATLGDVLTEEGWILGFCESRTVGRSWQ